MEKSKGAKLFNELYQEDLSKEEVEKVEEKKEDLPPIPESWDRFFQPKVVWEVSPTPIPDEDLPKGVKHLY